MRLTGNAGLLSTHARVVGKADGDVDLVQALEVEKVATQAVQLQHVGLGAQWRRRLLFQLFAVAKQREDGLSPRTGC